MCDVQMYTANNLL